jgi:hypothetical protein
MRGDIAGECHGDGEVALAVAGARRWLERVPASHRRVDGKNGSKGLGETPCAGRTACAAACGRCFFSRGFQAKTTGGGVASAAARGRDLQDGRIGCRGRVVGAGVVLDSSFASLRWQRAPV